MGVLGRCGDDFECEGWVVDVIGGVGVDECERDVELRV